MLSKALQRNAKRMRLDFQTSLIVALLKFLNDKGAFAPLRMTNDGSSGLNVAYLELVLRVVVEMRSSPVSFGSPMASTSLPV